MILSYYLSFNFVLQNSICISFAYKKTNLFRSLSFEEKCKLLTFVYAESKFKRYFCSPWYFWLTVVSWQDVKDSIIVLGFVWVLFLLLFFFKQLTATAFYVKFKVHILHISSLVQHSWHLLNSTFQLITLL